jgi:hypothetical protein
MTGNRQPDNPSNQPHRSTFNAFGQGVWAQTRGALLRNGYEIFEPQIRGEALAILRDGGVPDARIINPDAGGARLIEIVGSHVYSIYERAIEARYPAYDLPEPGADTFPRETAYAFIASVHRWLGGSAAATAKFLNRGLPTKDRSQALSRSSVSRAVGNYGEQVVAHVARYGGGEEERRLIQEIDRRIAVAICELYDAAKKSDGGAKLRGCALARWLLSRPDFESIAAASGRVEGALRAYDERCSQILS